MDMCVTCVYCAIIISPKHYTLYNNIVYIQSCTADHMMLCSHDPIAQALEMQQAEEEQQKLSITEIMKNPSKVVLLKVMLICLPNAFMMYCAHPRIWLDQEKLTMISNQRSLKNVPNMEKLSSVLYMR